MLGNTNMTSEKVSGLFKSEQSSYKLSASGWMGAWLGVLQNPDVVLTKDNKTITALYELMYDARIQSCISKRTNALKAYDIDIQASGVTKNKLNALKSYINDTIDVDDLIDNDADTYCLGFKTYEIMMKYINDYQCPILKPRLPDTMGFDQDDNLLFLSQKNPNGEIMPAYKFIVKRIKPADDQPYGESSLSRCYWYYVFKRIALRYWAQGTEEYAKPRPFAEYPLGWSTAEVTAFGDKIMDFAKRGLILVPEGTGLRYDSLQQLFQPDFFFDLITYCDDQISEVFLGQSLTMNNASTGTYGGRKVGETAELLFIMSDQKRVENILTTLANLFMMWNFGKEGTVKIKLRNQNDFKTDRAERDGILKNSLGVNFSKDYIAEQYGLDPAQFEMTDEKKEPESQSPVSPNNPESEKEKTKGKEYLNPETSEEELNA